MPRFCGLLQRAGRTFGRTVALARDVRCRPEFGETLDNIRALGRFSVGCLQIGF